MRWASLTRLDIGEAVSERRLCANPNSILLVLPVAPYARTGEGVAKLRSSRLCRRPEITDARHQARLHPGTDKAPAAPDSCPRGRLDGDARARSAGRFPARVNPE